MKADERRKKILALLQNSSKPISASGIASEYHVSRQIVVGDIALLRAQGYSIHATPRGYVIDPSLQEKNIRTIACKHDGSQMEQELNICVDHGCKVINVIVEHPIYGQLTGELQLATRYDIRQFIELFEKNKVHSLCELTNDIHLHTLECPDEETYRRVCQELDRIGILIRNE